MSLTTALRTTIYSLFHTLDKLSGQPRPLLTFMCYHSFADDAWFFSTKPEVFESHVQLLKRDYSFITMSEAEAHILGRKKLSRPSIVFTIDDGYQDIQSILPITQKYSIYPTVFLLGNPDHANRQELNNLKPFLSTREITTLSRAGWSFGSHTHTHPNLSSLSQADQLAELRESKKSLEHQLGTECRWIAYPRGSYNRETVEAAKKAGYRLGFTTDYTSNILASKPFEIPRIGVNATHLPKDLAVANSRGSYFLRYLVATFLK